MQKTLEDLAEEIKNETGLSTGTFGCFEIKPSKSAITLEYSESVKNFLNIEEISPVDIIQLEKDTDPRPLYFIPYNPNIAQEKEEEELCIRILFDRILSNIISEIGNADIPSSIVFTINGILNSSTFGVYEVWEDDDAKKHIKKLVKNFLINIKESMDIPARERFNFEPQKGWVFNIYNKEEQEELLKQLQKFKPENLDTSKNIEKNLFDDFDIES